MDDFAIPIRSPPRPALGGRLSSDERLARLVSGGSSWAFGLLYRRHHQALYRYCRSIVRDEQDAQDALQSAMLRALVALQAEERDLAVRPWLFRIVHNEAVSLVRRRRPDVPLVEELEPSELGVERTLEERERLATLVRDVNALAERQRSALVMRELSGLSIEEIAAVLSTSPGAAKQTIFEARCSLREFMEGRAMQCEQVRRAISDGDRRTQRGRKLQGHLRECRGCREFDAMIGERSAALRALAPPLPAAAASVMLGRLLAHGAHSGHAGGLAAASGAVVGKPVVTSLAIKAVFAVGVVTLAAGGARLAFSPRPRAHVSPAGSQSAYLPASAAGSGAHVNAGGMTSRAARSREMLPVSKTATMRRRANGTTPLSGATSPGAFAAVGSPLTGPLRPGVRGNGATGAARHGLGMASYPQRTRAGYRGSPAVRRGSSGNHRRLPTPLGGHRPRPAQAQGAAGKGAAPERPHSGAANHEAGAQGTTPTVSWKAAPSKEAHAP